MEGGAEHSQPVNSHLKTHIIIKTVSTGMAVMMVVMVNSQKIGIGLKLKMISRSMIMMRKSYKRIMMMIMMTKSCRRDFSLHRRGEPRSKSRSRLSRRRQNSRVLAGMRI